MKKKLRAIINETQMGSTWVLLLNKNQHDSLISGENKMPGELLNKRPASFNMLIEERLNKKEIILPLGSGEYP